MISWALIWLLLGHPHPQPVTCMDVCGDINCKCWEKCRKKGLIPPNECTVACNDRADKCEKDCEGGGT